MIELFPQKKAADFRAMRYHAYIGKDVRLQSYGPELNFVEMDNGRISSNMESLFTTGFDLANLGVSVVLTTGYKDKRYLLLTPTGNNISGYVETKHKKDPFNSILEEIAEELLIKKDQMLLPGMFETYIPRPYEMMQESGPALIRQQQRVYHDFPFILVDSHSSPLAGTINADIYVDNKKLEYNPQIFFDSNHGSANIVYSLDISQIGHHEDLTYRHTEEKLQDGLVVNNDTSKLMTLVELDPRITNKTFNMVNGELIPVRVDSLSEQFCDTNRGIVSTKSIGFDKYVKKSEYVFPTQAFFQEILGDFMKFTGDCFFYDGDIRLVASA